MRLPLVVTSLLVCSVAAIFEDQVGKFDWRKQLIGCPSKIVFDRTESKSDRLIVSTEQSVLASLALNTGSIEWRRIMEAPSESSTGLVFTTSKSEIYSISEDGRSLRVWRKSDGALVHQLPISDEQSKQQAIHLANNNVFVATGKTLASYSKNGEKPLGSVVSTGEKLFSSFFHRENELTYVSSVSKGKLEVIRVNEDGSFEAASIVDFPFDSERCHAQTAFVTCFQGTTLTVLDVFSQKVVKTEVDFVVESATGFESTMIARGARKLRFFEVSNGKLNAQRTVEIEMSEHLGLVEEQAVAVLVSGDSIRIVSANSADDFTVKRQSEGAVPKYIWASRAKNSHDYELVVVGNDCRIEMLTVNGVSKEANVEWAKEESLINSVAVEMVDLPLSESQQMIEDEFEGADSNIVSAFLRRIQVQFGQLVRFVTKTVEKSIYVVTSISQRGNGLSDFITSIRSASGSIESAAPFERDYFNLRKVIIVTSSDGVIFGLDSNDGSVLWKIWLGDDFSPLESHLEKKRVPLFVQRTTAHYQLDGLASVVFSSRKTRNGVIVSFNPMIGKVTEKRDLPFPIKRVSLLPVVNNKHVHPIMITGNSDQISIIPSISPEELGTCQSLYLLDVDSKSVQGLKADLVNQKLEVTWTGNIGLAPTDEIIAVKGKPFHQKVHSQGRVLVTRDVQYKYVNPNLAAVAALDKVSGHLSIVLVDIVTGQIVHSASIGKAAGPIHLVHSENWIAYSFWSEKGRRTELGVIELYEGSDEISQKELFDSKIPNKMPPVVMTQSYIYAQGVDAMSVSETEQGLTTRSILLAHPSGGIHEVSRRLLDATRPMELTQAMREEMMIGYMPEIAVGTEEMINYNQTVHRVRGIKTSASGLESTSLVLAYGTDLFFTRLVPSGTFDILKDDFDHVLISLVLTGLVLGSYITKRLARSNALAAQWA